MLNMTGLLMDGRVGRLVKQTKDFGAGNAKHVGKITALIGDVKGL